MPAPRSRASPSRPACPSTIRSASAAGRCGARSNAPSRPSRPARRAPEVTLHLTHEVLQLGLRDPFRIARSDHDAGHAVTTVMVDVRDDRWPDVAGFGEGYPDRFYGDTVATMAAVFPLLLDAVGQLEPTRAGLVAAGDRMARAIAHHGGAKCALDIALHDLVGQVSFQGMADLRDLHGPIPPTDFTLGLDEPAVVA